MRSYINMPILDEFSIYSELTSRTKKCHSGFFNILIRVNLSRFKLYYRPKTFYIYSMYKRGLRHYVLQIIHIENGFPMFMKCVVFYISVCSEAFVYCFAGEYLNIKVIKQCTEIPNRSISGYAITTDSVTK